MQLLQLQNQNRAAEQENINKNLNSIAQGFQAIGDARERQKQEDLQKEETARQIEAKKRQDAYNVLNTTSELRKSGFDVTPDQVNQAITDGTGLAGLFNNKTQEYKAKVAEDAQNKAIDRQYKQSQIAENYSKAQKLKNDSAVANNPTQKALKEAGAEGRKSIGGIAEGLKSLQQMEFAVKNGDGPTMLNSSTPFVGNLISDTPYTSAERVLVDVVGRLQSGGAINSDEGASFKAMGPRPNDTPEVKMQKLASQKSFLLNKLKANGLDESQLREGGFNVDYHPPQRQAVAGNNQGLNQAQVPGMSEVPYSQVTIPMLPQAQAQGQGSGLMSVDPQKAARLQELRLKKYGR